MLLSIGCTSIPAKPASTVSVQPLAQQTAHTRTMETPPYGGGDAIIFVLDQVNSDSMKNIAYDIIRVFGENDAPLSVALPPSSPNGTFNDLVYYADAGIIDISVDGYAVRWLSSNAVNSSAARDELRTGLINSREQFKFTFGESPAACILQPEAITEPNYRVLQDTGFKVVCSANSDNIHPSVQPATWNGNPAPDGLYWLPVIGNLDYSSISAGKTPDSTQVDPDAKILGAIQDSLQNLGVGVIEIQPALFMGQENKADTKKLALLANLIKTCHSFGEITTLESWYQFTSSLTSIVSTRHLILPPYAGGPVIIFRLDDIAKGYQEESIKDIINVFQSNGVPLDCGVVAFANGIDSYQIPWLKQYADQNAVGISVHGYDWTYYQLDTTRELRSLLMMQNNPCINWATARLNVPSENLSYWSIKSKLLKARALYLKYYGFAPVALTVPTDFFDEGGYKAVQDAGFKVFATQIQADPHPSTTYPVDYNGVRAPNGMYRIPTASDVCMWGDNCTWGNVFDLSKQASINDYCKYHNAWEDVVDYNDFSAMLCPELEQLGVASIGIHPDCIADQNGKVDRVKLARLDKIVKWCKSFATIMTFEQWYVMTSGQK